MSETKHETKYSFFPGSSNNSDVSEIRDDQLSPDVPFILPYFFKMCHYGKVSRNLNSMILIKVFTHKTRYSPFCQSLSLIYIYIPTQIPKKETKVLVQCLPMLTVMVQNILF